MYSRNSPITSCRLDTIESKYAVEMLSLSQTRCVNRFRLKKADQLEELIYVACCCCVMFDI